MTHIQDEIALVLCMIVRNESNNINRCFNSFLYQERPIFRGMCITDTGSADNTKELVKQWADKYGVKLVLTEQEFRDFGYNRSRNIVEAQINFPDYDYMLFCDADMKMEFYPDKWTSDKIKVLSKQIGGFNVDQYNSNIMYPNQRLALICQPWKCILRTHEFYRIDSDAWINSIPNNKRYDIKSKRTIDNWIEAEGLPNYESLKRQLDKESRIGALECFRYHDIGDGGHKQDKFERDVRLIKLDLEEFNGVPEYMQRCNFYLGNTYRNLKQYKEAIKCYYIRSTLGGYYQEVYQSLCYMGECYEQLGNDNVGYKRHKYYSLAIGHYINAYNTLPSRIESLYKLARLVRYHKGHPIASDILWMIKDVPCPPSGLFLEFWVYKYGCLFELAQCAHLAGKPAYGKEAIRRLFKMKDELTNELNDKILSASMHYRKTDTAFDQECHTLLGPVKAIPVGVNLADRTGLTDKPMITPALVETNTTGEMMQALVVKTESDLVIQELEQVKNAILAEGSKENKDNKVRGGKTKRSAASHVSKQVEEIDEDSE